MALQTPWARRAAELQVEAEEERKQVELAGGPLGRAADYVGRLGKLLGAGTHRLIGGAVGTVPWAIDTENTLRGLLGIGSEDRLGGVREVARLTQQEIGADAKALTPEDLRGKGPIQRIKDRPLAAIPELAIENAPYLAAGLLGRAAPVLRALGPSGATTAALAGPLTGMAYGEALDAGAAPGGRAAAGAALSGVGQAALENVGLAGLVGDLVPRNLALRPVTAALAEGTEEVLQGGPEELGRTVAGVGGEEGTLERIVKGAPERFVGGAAAGGPFGFLAQPNEGARRFERQVEGTLKGLFAGAPAETREAFGLPAEETTGQKLGLPWAKERRAAKSRAKGAADLQAAQFAIQGLSGTEADLAMEDVEVIHLPGNPTPEEFEALGVTISPENRSRLERGAVARGLHYPAREGEKAKLILTGRALPNTLWHELGHRLDSKLTESQRKLIPPELAADSEAFAGAWENYGLTGLAPTKQLEQLFGIMQQDIAASVEANDFLAKRLDRTGLSPEMADFFDAVVGGRPPLAMLADSSEKDPEENPLLAKRAEIREKAGAEFELEDTAALRGVTEVKDRAGDRAIAQLGNRVSRTGKRLFTSWGAYEPLGDELGPQVFQYRIAQGNAVAKAELAATRLAKDTERTYRALPKNLLEDQRQRFRDMLHGELADPNTLDPRLREIAREVRDIQDSQSRELAQTLIAQLPVEHQSTALEDAIELNRAFYPLKQELDIRQAKFEEGVEGVEAPTDAEYSAALDQAVEQVMEGALPGYIKSVMQARGAATIMENLGTWMRRTYMAHIDPQWHLDIWERGKPGKRYHELVPPAIAELRDQDPTMAELSDGQIFNQYLLPMIRSDAGAFFGLTARSGEVTQAAKALRRRQKLGPGLMAFLGEVEMETGDPVLSFLEGIVRQRQLIEAAHFQTALATAGEGSILWHKDDPAQPLGADAIIKVGLELGPDGKPRSKTMVTLPEYAEALQENHTHWVNTSNLLGKAYLAAMGATKWSLTVGNPITHLRNLTFWVEGALSGGHNPAIYGKALAAVASDNPLLRRRTATALGYDSWSDLQRDFEDSVGYIGYGGARAGRAREVAAWATVKGATKEGRTIEPRPFWKSPAALAKSVTELYQKEDAYPRFFLWKQEVARQREIHPDLSDEQLKQLAGDIIMRTTPTWEMAPPITRAMRTFPMLFPFPTFTAEWWRSRVETFRLAREDMQSDNPAQRKAGMLRFAGAITATFLLHRAVSQAVGYLFGFEAPGEEEDEAIRAMVAPWSRHSPLGVKGDPETGKVHYLDWSTLYPAGGYLDAPINAFLNDGPEEALVTFLQENANLQPEPLFQTVNEMWGHWKGSEGTPEGRPERAAKTVAHGAKKLAPGRSLFIRPALAAAGHTDRWGRSYDLKLELLANVMPVKPTTGEPVISFQNSYRDVLRSRRNLDTWWREPSRDVTTPTDELMKRIPEAEAHWKSEVWPKLAEMANHQYTLEVETLGATDEQARARVMLSLQGAGLSETYRGFVLASIGQPDSVAPPLITSTSQLKSLYSGQILRKRIANPTGQTPLPWE